MSPVSRRILVYWLLLLVPTIVIGFGAMQLLRREHARLAEQEDYASESRRAAIIARAGLIVENVELLVGDVQAGLLDALAATPARAVESELAALARANPLVRVAFRARADGELLHVAAADDNEEANGFRRRMTAHWRGAPPWESEPEEKAPVREEFAPSTLDAAPSDEVRARQQASANVVKVQSARRDAQTVARSSSFPSTQRRGDAQAAPAPTAGASAERSEPSHARLGTTELAREIRRGWTPISRDGRQHLIGWIVRTADVVGIELELAGLVARIGAALPDETGGGEGFALLDERGRIMHQTGFVRRDRLAMASIPISARALPGWEVVAYYDAPVRSRGAGATFLALGSVLVGILLVAILAGGSLLFWQARRSEAEAAQKTSFVANVSHEFKTPLTTIRLYAELLENGRVAAAEKRAEYLRTIGRETQRLARLVGNALDFSRLEQGKKKFMREPLDLAAELARIAETQALRAGGSGVILQTELAEARMEIVTDRDAVEQVVVNLLDNAAKYGAGGGEVILRLEPRERGGARVSVLDRGPGVPAAHRERIFEKFHRVDETLTAEHGGAGLGLSIARQLARGLGGELRYEAREGGGAAFVLELP